MSRKNKKTARSVIPNSFLPNFFTLCALQVFATQDDAKCFYEAFCHFRSFGSATCLIADKLRGALDMVSTILRKDDGSAISPAFKCGGVTITPCQ